MSKIRRRKSKLFVDYLGSVIVLTIDVQRFTISIWTSSYDSAKKRTSY